MKGYLSAEVRISVGSAHSILDNDLNLQYRWQHLVLKTTIADQDVDFLNSIITWDEFWYFFYYPQLELHSYE
jgi:hypothetical protein